MKELFISRLNALAHAQSDAPQLFADTLTATGRVLSREIICRRDSPVTGYPVILSGWAARCQFLPGGARQIVGLLLPGDIAFLGRKTGVMRDEEITALSSCNFAWLKVQETNELILGSEKCRDLLEAYAELEFSVATSWLLNLGRRDAFERSAHLICELHYRLSQVGLVTNDAFAFPLKQHEFADLLGLTAVHISRKVSQLKNDGLVDLTSREVRILDLARLRHLAGFDAAYLGERPPLENLGRVR